MRRICLIRLSHDRCQGLRNRYFVPAVAVQEEQTLTTSPKDRTYYFLDDRGVQLGRQADCPGHIGMVMRRSEPDRRQHQDAVREGCFNPIGNRLYLDGVNEDGEMMAVLFA